MNYVIDPELLAHAVYKISGDVRPYIKKALAAMTSGEGLDNYPWILEARKPRGRKLEGGYSEAFLTFWKTYPNVRRNGKGEAYKAWSKIRLPEKSLLELCLKALAWQAQTKSWQDGYVPMPSTYLNQRRFDDDPPEGHRAPEVYQDMNGIWRSR